MMTTLNSSPLLNLVDRFAPFFLPLLLPWPLLFVATAVGKRRFVDLRYSKSINRVARALLVLLESSLFFC